MNNPLFTKNLASYLEGLKQRRDQYKAFLDEETTKPSQQQDNLISKNQSVSFDTINAALARFIIEKGWIDAFNNPEKIPSSRSSIDWERSMLLLESRETLEYRDPKRAIMGSAVFARYVFDGIINEKTINLEILTSSNPLRIKYGSEFTPNFTNENLPTTIYISFEFLRDYVNEISHAIDSANIGGLTGATDFLQLYNAITEIVESSSRKDLIAKVINIIKSDDIHEFEDRVISLKKGLEEANKQLNNFKITRLYNRLWYISSYFVNSLKPEIFPIYFPDTRGVCEKFGLNSYKSVCNFYSEFIKNSPENIAIQYVSLLNIDEINFDGLAIEGFTNSNIPSYSQFANDVQRLRTYLKNRAIYRCFQDALWMYNLPTEDVTNYIYDFLKVPSSSLSKDGSLQNEGKIHIYDYIIYNGRSRDTAPLAIIEIKSIPTKQAKDLLPTKTELFKKHLNSAVGVNNGYLLITENDGRIQYKYFFKKTPNGEIIQTEINQDEVVPTYDELVKVSRSTLH